MGWVFIACYIRTSAYKKKNFSFHLNWKSVFVQLKVSVTLAIDVGENIMRGIFSLKKCCQKYIFLFFLIWEILLLYLKSKNFWDGEDNRIGKLISRIIEILKKWISIPFEDFWLNLSTELGNRLKLDLFEFFDSRFLMLFFVN